MQRITNSGLQAALERIRKPPAWAGKEPSNLCQECDDTGWVRDHDTDRVSRCARCQSKLRGQAPGVPAEEHGSFLDNFTQTADNHDAITQAKYFLDGVHPDLYLAGGIGTGKTRLACSLLNEFWKAGTAVQFYRVPRLLATLLPGADDLDGIIDTVAKVPVICLDDVGASQATDFARRMLLVIYEARGDQGQRTIWTSNLDLGELAEFTQDDRLTSRIAGRAKVTELRGKDWRLKRAKARR